MITIKSKCLSVRPSVCLYVCTLCVGERLDGYAQFFLELVGEVQGSFFNHKTISTPTKEFNANSHYLLGLAIIYLPVQS